MDGALFYSMLVTIEDYPNYSNRFSSNTKIGSNTYFEGFLVKYTFFGYYMSDVDRAAFMGLRKFSGSNNNSAYK